MCKYPILKGLSSFNWMKKVDWDDYILGKAIAISCGKCFNCRMKKFSKLKLKATAEIIFAKHRYKENLNVYFVTLTYDELNYEKNKSRYYVQELQKMFKRLRKLHWSLEEEKYLKYIFVSELGSKTNRLHHHGIIITNKDILPKKPGGKRIHNNYYYNNANISWKYGFHSITKVNLEDSNAVNKAVGYVIKYMLKTPLKVQVSKELGRKWIDLQTKEDGTFILNGFKFRNFWKKQLLTNEELIELNKQMFEDLKIKEQKNDLRTKREIKF